MPLPSFFPNLSPVCPVEALPDLLFNAVLDVMKLDDDIAVICPVLDSIAVSVHAVHRLYDVQGLDHRTMPTTVNTLTVAPSGTGKGTSYHEFFGETSAHSTQAQLKGRKLRAKMRRLERAKVDFDEEDYQPPDGLILQHVSYRAMMDMLDGTGRAGSINHEDGASFLDSDLPTRYADKLTQLSSGFPDLTHTVNRVELNAVSARCALGIRIQPKLLYPHLIETRNRAFDQGGWFRSLVGCHDPNRFGVPQPKLGRRRPGGGMGEFQTRLKAMLVEGDRTLGSRTPTRPFLTLDVDARVFMHGLKYNLKGWRERVYADIDPAAARAWETTLRLAAVFQVMCVGDGKIGLDMVERAWRIVEWSLTQHRQIFVEAIKPEPKMPVASPGEPSRQATIPKPEKRPRPIQEAEWILQCFDKLRGYGSQHRLSEVETLAGVHGQRLKTALAWLKHENVIEIVGRGENAVMRVHDLPYSHPTQPWLGHR